MRVLRLLVNSVCVGVVAACVVVVGCQEHVPPAGTADGTTFLPPAGETAGPFGAPSDAQFGQLAGRVTNLEHQLSALVVGHTEQQTYISDLARTSQSQVEQIKLIQARVAKLEGAPPTPQPPTPQPPAPTPTPAPTPQPPPTPHNPWQVAFAATDPNGFAAGSFYDRPTLGQVMKGPGVFDFAIIEAGINNARSKGGKYSFRIMFARGDGQGGANWMRNAGYRGFEYTVDGNRGWHPDVADPRVMQAIESLFVELGKNYDGKGVLEYVDAPGWGIDGEWHSNPRGAQLFPHPSQVDCRALIDIMHRTFPNTPKLALLHLPSVFPGPGEACRYALSKGWGWRVDAFGATDLWTQDYYARGVTELGIDKHAPVAFEPTGYMGSWGNAEWTAAEQFAARVLSPGEKWYLQNKGQPVPTAMHARLKALLARW